jgi:hypothetical protein
MFFFGTLEHTVGDYSFNEYVRIVAQSAPAARLVLDRVAGKDGTPDGAGGYFRDMGRDWISIENLVELEPVAFESVALQQFAVFTDGSDRKPDDFPEFVKEAAKRIVQALAARGHEVGQSVMLHVVSAAIGETDWQKLRTKFAGCTDPVAAMAHAEPAQATGAVNCEKVPLVRDAVRYVLDGQMLDALSHYADAHARGNPPAILALSKLGYSVEWEANFGYRWKLTNRGLSEFSDIGNETAEEAWAAAHNDAHHVVDEKCRQQEVEVRNLVGPHHVVESWRLRQISEYVKAHPRGAAVDVLALAKVGVGVALADSMPNGYRWSMRDGDEVLMRAPDAQSSEEAAYVEAHNYLHHLANCTRDVAELWVFHAATAQ